jgi:hypothetical protein
MATVIYNEDADVNIATEPNVPFPLDLPERSFSVTSGSADAEAEAAAATPPTNNGGVNKSRVAKAGIALLALIAVVFAIIYGTNGTADDGGPSNIAPLPESSTSTNKAIDIEPKNKPPPPKKGDVKPLPPPKIAELKTLAPTKAKVTKAPIPPKPAPITTPYPTDQNTFTVSTETTGPPTLADRNETRYF